MNKEKIDKNCCVRLPNELHRLVKLEAYKEGNTIQEWIIKMIMEKLDYEKKH